MEVTRVNVNFKGYLVVKSNQGISFATLNIRAINGWNLSINFLFYYWLVVPVLSSCLWINPDTTALNPTDTLKWATCYSYTTVFS